MKIGLLAWSSRWPAPSISKTLLLGASVLSLVAPTGCTTFSDTSFPESVSDSDSFDIGDGTQGDSGSDVAPSDAGADTSSGLNSCGGTSELLETPGAVCTSEQSGGCPGIWVCDGADGVQCAVVEGAACTESGRAETRVIGAPCDTCLGDDGSVQVGRWVDSEDGPTCSHQRNPCGGCEEIDQLRLGYECNSSEGQGTLTCSGPNTLTCQPQGRNPCGGTGALDSVPGLPCGDGCGEGVFVCDGLESLRCAIPDDVEFDTCLQSLAQPGTPCAPCRTWQMDEEVENVVCAIDTDSSAPECAHCADNGETNACGGCAVLAEEPGQFCESGRFACAGPDAIACVVDSIPECSGAGSSPLPGEPCSNPPAAPATGQWVCATPTQLVCAYASPASELSVQCIGAPRYQPNATCGYLHVWKANTSGAGTDCVECVRNDAVNLCGREGESVRRPDQGGAALEEFPGTACGRCVLGMVGCTTSTSAECLSESEPALVDWFLDDDDDTYGDPDELLQLCPGEDPPAGYVDNNEDCDDSRDSINPGATEIVGDEIDNDCRSGSVCYGFVDRDGDGFGSCTGSTPLTDANDRIPVVSADDDCRDLNESRFPRSPLCDCLDSVALGDFPELQAPGRGEVCGDGLDNDCDGEIDNPVNHFYDADGDGYGDPGRQFGLTETCIDEEDFALYVANNDDCDDTNAQINPGAPEICGNATDDDCDMAFDNDDLDRGGCFPASVLEE